MSAKTDKTEREAEIDALREENAKLVEANKTLAEDNQLLTESYEALKAVIDARGLQVDVPPAAPFEKPVAQAHGSLLPTDGRDGVTRPAGA